MSSSGTRRGSDFGGRAADYDRLRPGFGEIEDMLVREGDLRGRRVLDIGCGTGRFAARLADEEHAKVWGIDREPKMIEVARARGSRAQFKVAEAERLPFKDAWFERATMQLVLHHVERPRALPEVHRVLAADGRFACLSFDPDYFHLGNLVRWFPSMLEVDRRRFPDEAQLRGELAAAGFGAVRAVRDSRPYRATRERLLEGIRARHISTFDLISEEEYREGLARAERDMPEVCESGNVVLIVVAES